MASPSPLVRRHKTISPVPIIAAIAVIAVALSYVLLNAGNAITISTATTLNITKSATVLRIGDGTYAIALARTTPSHNVAYVYLNKLPAFMNPLLNVTLYQGQATKVNAGASFANVELQLTSVGSNAVTMMITPISTSLDIAPDSSFISTVQTALQGTASGSGTSNNITLPSSTTVPPSTTIAPPSNTGVTTTSVQSTVPTTIAGTNTTKAKVLAALQKSVYYPLMLNYSTIYANTLNCTPTLYNTTYRNANGGVAPSGYSTFQNVSQYVPYALYSNISSKGSGTYDVVYYTKTISTEYNKVAALTIGINASAGTLLTANLSGFFQGANEITLSKGYKTATSTGGACGIYVI